MSTRKLPVAWLRLRPTSQTRRCFDPGCTDPAQAKRLSHLEISDSNQTVCKPSNMASRSGAQPCQSLQILLVASGPQLLLVTHDMRERRAKEEHLLRGRHGLQLSRRSAVRRKPNLTRPSAERRELPDVGAGLNRIGTGRVVDHTPGLHEPCGRVQVCFPCFSGPLHGFTKRRGRAPSESPYGLSFGGEFIATLAAFTRRSGWSG